MLQKPSIPDHQIITCLQTDFSLQVNSLTFLPFGADLNTAVYRAIDHDGEPYFVKLRRGAFDELSVVVPEFFREQGIEHVIPPHRTGTGALWADLDAYKVILYPYTDGHDGYEVELSAGQWADLGKAFRLIHNLHLPDYILIQLRQENWSPANRDALQKIMADLQSYPTVDSLSAQLLKYSQDRRPVILELIHRAAALAELLQRRSLDPCLCHGDLHAGNLLIHAKGDFYIVDWDDLLFAPKEKDLMSVGAGLFGGWIPPGMEMESFYRGYGQVEIDREALTYYRCERILADLAVECRQILQAEGSQADRQQAFRWLQSNFEPGGSIALAYSSFG